MPRDTARAVCVMTIEVDSTWGVKPDVVLGVSQLDLLAWYARANGYDVRSRRVLPANP